MGVTFFYFDRLYLSALHVRVLCQNSKANSIMLYDFETRVGKHYSKHSQQMSQIAHSVIKFEVLSCSPISANLKGKIGLAVLFLVGRKKKLLESFYWVNTTTISISQWILTIFQFNQSSSWHALISAFRLKVCYWNLEIAILLEATEWLPCLRVMLSSSLSLLFGFLNSALNVKPVSCSIWL